jgi:hypothetical protein
MMQILLAVLLVALVLAALLRKKAPAVMTPVIVALLVLAVTVQGMLAVRGCQATFWAAESVDFFEAAGYRLGQVIPTHVPDGGPILVIHGGGDADSARRVRDAYLNGLRTGLDSRAHEIVEADSSLVEMGEMLSLEQSLTLDQLPQYLQQCPEATAVVSMVGIPHLRPGTRAPPGFPPLFILGSPRSGAADVLFRAGVLKAAVFFKGSYDRDAKPTRKMPMDELFDQRFELVETPN